VLSRERLDHRPGVLGRLPGPGDLVRIVPNHSCVVSNLVEAAWLVEGSDVVERLEISARGCIT